MAITKRSEWQAKKTKHGIPDKVCSFSMGERFESWNKKFEAAGQKKDVKARAAAMEGLVKDLKAYQKALTTIKADKFKGNTPQEKQKNLADTKTLIQNELAIFEANYKTYAALAAPVDTIKKNLPGAKNTLGTIAQNDLQGLKTFYSEQLRNEVGKYVKMALAQKPKEPLKSALENYEKAGGYVDSEIDDCSANDHETIKKMWAACKVALEVLGQAIG